MKDVETLQMAKNRREIAQYSVTKRATRTIAEQIRKDAYVFVNRIAALLSEVK